MNEPEIKSKTHNFGKDFDLNSQEIEKTNFFLVESQLKDFSELVYLCSSINKKYTALLYREKDHTYLYLFVLKHIINKPKENISYKIKAKLKFNKAEIDKTALEDKQMFIDDQANKNTYNEYSITLVNRDLILLQVIGKKIMIVNFDKKEYTVLFCNSSDKKSIQVVSTYDELIVTKKDDTKKFQIRTYIFCISSYGLLVDRSAVTVPAVPAHGRCHHLHSRLLTFSLYDPNPPSCSSAARRSRPAICPISYTPGIPAGLLRKMQQNDSYAFCGRAHAPPHCPAPREVPASEDS